MFLRRLSFLNENIPSRKVYPFSMPAFKGLDTIEFKNTVTFFIGENGSGKSTLMEAIAYKCDFNTAGGGRNNYYEVPSSESALGDFIRLAWSPKVTNGFFLRAESFYNFASHIDSLGPEAYLAYGGKSLHEQSHGESFLSIFSNRFGKKGIYLLDEPEAALSPTRQMALLKIIRELDQEGQSQFIIATHSPIILAYPGAQILDFDTSPVSETAYEETSHYQITKGFMDNRDLYLRKLFEE
ncbi:AAA family ATPase [Pelotomaculum terephthalicicum JT]|uniref:AAA family ATPase n=1 Tax=Pelotomaculum sp. PtaB.Bin117 TaxID=1811694 RepID=UPI0009D25D58|nr:MULTISPECIES: AAA family ATPase [Pelotomaculum]MCG9967335.1 AAA family ATPase [Pelotomaculum terephthalicicum JT]OPX90686.1 MAG: recombination protein F [Pelotomaculum sp. PtaB.Bin117]OPY61310.1 MAG: recombination protein F [Pelotomaculum sp. PtaU1.Bin065]